LIEDDGLLGDSRAGFGSVVAVIESNRNKIADMPHAWSDSRIAGNERKLLDRLLANFCKTLRRERIPRQVWNGFGQIAHGAFGVEDTGFFTAARAEADELHERNLSRSEEMVRSVQRVGLVPLRPVTLSAIDTLTQKRRSLKPEVH